MKNIVLARVDDRLIHTEILTLWVPEVRANRIIIVDDVVAKDKFRSKVIKEMAPQGLIIHVYGIDRATEKLKEAPSFDGERVIVIAESPLVFEELIKRGIKINQLNIGGMGIRGERKAVARRVACDTMEMEAIHELIKKHVHVYFQTVPTRSSEEAKKCGRVKTEDQKKHLHESPAVMTVPLIILAVLALLGGFLNIPANLQSRAKYYVQRHPKE
jgi:PTS system mannose-specific IIB component